MKYIVSVVALVLFASVANASSTFIVPFWDPAFDCNHSFNTPLGSEWEPAISNEFHDPTVDLRGVTKFRFIAQGTSANGTAELSVQQSIDGADFSCLGTVCSAVTILENATLNDPGPYVMLPVEQRNRDSTLRMVHRSPSGRTDTFYQACAASVEFYRP